MTLRVRLGQANLAIWVGQFDEARALARFLRPRPFGRPAVWLARWPSPTASR